MPVNTILRQVSVLAVCATAMIFLGGCGGMSWDQANLNAKPNTGFLHRQVTVDGEVHNYAVFIPHNYTADRKWPMIMFLHGIMEGGSDGTGCTKVGMGPYIATRPEQFDFIVAFPQIHGGWKGKDSVPDKIAMAVLDDVQHSYSVDTGCVTLTGLSTGGFGVWALGAAHPDRFSALVPMAGYTDYDEVALLTKTPIWCFHNSGDFLVSCDGSRQMIERIKAAGPAVEPKLTVFEQGGHTCWDDAFTTEGLFDWMKSQHISGGAMTVAPAAPTKTQTP